MSLAKQLAKAPLRMMARVELKRLRGLDAASASMIADAVKDSLSGKLSGEEQAWVDRIEALRKELCASTEILSIRDYGAGSTDTRTDAQTPSGVVEVDRSIGGICRRASKPYFWALLLFHLIRRFEPEQTLELGTCLGISGAYQAAALKLNGKGRLTTLEGDPSLAKRATANLESLNLDNTRVVEGRFSDTLGGVLDETPALEYAFIDGHHDKTATLEYFEKIRPVLAGRALLVFDDISWSQGMREAWDHIENDAAVNLTLNMRTLGIAVFDPEIASKAKFSMPLVG